MIHECCSVSVILFNHRGLGYLHPQAFRILQLLNTSGEWSAPRCSAGGPKHLYIKGKNPKRHFHLIILEVLKWFNGNRFAFEGCVKRPRFTTARVEQQKNVHLIILRSQFRILMMPHPTLARSQQRKTAVWAGGANCQSQQI